MNTGDAPVPSQHGLLTTVALEARRRASSTRSRAARSSPAPRCSGCATGSASSRSAREIEALAAIGAGLGRRGGRAGARGPGRAALAARGARHHQRPRRAARRGAHRARRARGHRAAESRSPAARCRRDAGVPLGTLKVDGGAGANDLLMQFQADVLGRARSCARRSSRRRRSARRCSPASPPACGRTRATPHARGERSAASRPRCPKPRSTPTSPAGAPPSNARSQLELYFRLIRSHRHRSRDKVRCSMNNGLARALLPMCQESRDRGVSVAPLALRTLCGTTGARHESRARRAGFRERRVDENFRPRVCVSSG